MIDDRQNTGHSVNTPQIRAPRKDKIQALARPLLKTPRRPIFRHLPMTKIPAVTRWPIATCRQCRWVGATFRAPSVTKTSLHKSCDALDLRPSTGIVSSPTKGRTKFQPGPPARRLTRLFQGEDVLAPGGLELAGGRADERFQAPDRRHVLAGAVHVGVQR